MGNEETIIGSVKIRKDARNKVVGKAKYTADIPMENLKYGFIVRSPHHHARIIEIDKSQAAKSEGVLAVLTAEDIPGSVVFGPLVQDQPSLAQDVVRHLGEPVALVIANTWEEARNGGELLQITYEPLEAVFDPVRALEPGAPQFHPDGNLASELNVFDGDIVRGFEPAEYIFEELFELPGI